MLPHTYTGYHLHHYEHKVLMFNAYYTYLYEERAAILEYDAGLTREEAEDRAYHEILEEFTNSLK